MTGEARDDVALLDVESTRDTDSLFHICTVHCVPGMPSECAPGCVSMCGRRMRLDREPRTDVGWLPDDCIVCSSVWESLGSSSEAVV